MALVGHPGMDLCNYGTHRLRGIMFKKIMAPLGHVIRVPQVMAPIGHVDI